MQIQIGFVTFVRKRVNVGEDNKNKLGDLLSRRYIICSKIYL